MMNLTISNASQIPQVTMDVKEDDVKLSFILFQFFHEQEGNQHAADEEECVHRNGGVEDGLHLPFASVLSWLQNSLKVA